MSDADLLALAIVRTRVSYFTAEERLRLAELCVQLTGQTINDGL